MIERIREKLDRLKTKDKKYMVFGSSSHEYVLNAPKSEVELVNFESTHKINLPQGYRDFLKQIGNGGAGPYYGLLPLEKCLDHNLDFPDGTLIDPGQKFAFEEPWNLAFSSVENESDYDKLVQDQGYNDSKWSNGMIHLANFGCGVSINLVVNGKEYGHIWVDDRCNDQGIYPDHYFGNEKRIDFLEWYELWLDSSLKKRFPKK